MMKNKENNKANFIKTKDRDTYEEMIKLGFELIDDTNGTWTFLNNTEYPIKFEKNKIVYSDVLCF